MVKKMRLLSLAIVMIVMSLQANAQQWGLYTLYATDGGTTTYLIDTNNTVYKTWTFLSTKKNAYSTYLVTPGDTLVRTYQYAVSGSPGQGGETGGIQKVLWNGTVYWDFTYSSTTYQMHHDICPMPNGHILFIACETKSAAEATAAGCSPGIALYAEKIMEVARTGTNTYSVVWEWHLWDHLCQGTSSSYPHYVTSFVNNPQMLNINYYTASGADRWHMNGIDYNPVLDQIVISMHNVNQVYVIDHSTTTAEAAGHTGGNSGMGGDFLYRWGNPTSYGASGSTIFNVVHDAHWVPSDNPLYPNYLCGYNNKGGTGGKTAVDIWNPPYSGNNYTLTLGQAYTPSTYAYRFNSVFTANNKGNSQQLPNGNMLVNNPMGSIYEVNSAGTQLWTKTSANSTHAYRYTKCQVRGPIASATVTPSVVSPGTPVSLSSSATSVTETSPTYTYSWTSVPAGFTASTQNAGDTPNSTVTYIVTITNTAIGCSDTASVTVDVMVGLNEVNNLKNLSVFPNPTSGIVSLDGEFVKGYFQLSILTPRGEIVYKGENQKTLDLSSLPDGVYFLNFTAEDATTITRKLILYK